MKYWRGKELGLVVKRQRSYQLRQPHPHGATVFTVKTFYAFWSLQSFPDWSVLCSYTYDAYFYLLIVYIVCTYLYFLLKKWRNWFLIVNHFTEVFFIFFLISDRVKWILKSFNEKSEYNLSATTNTDNT